LLDFALVHVFDQAVRQAEAEAADRERRAQLEREQEAKREAAEKAERAERERRKEAERMKMEREVKAQRAVNKGAAPQDDVKTYEEELAEIRRDYFQRRQNAQARLEREYKGPCTSFAQPAPRPPRKPRQEVAPALAPEPQVIEQQQQQQPMIDSEENEKEEEVMELMEMHSLMRSVLAESAKLQEAEDEEAIAEDDEEEDQPVETTPTDPRKPLAEVMPSQPSHAEPAPQERLGLWDKDTHIKKMIQKQAQKANRLRMQLDEALGTEIFMRAHMALRKAERCETEAGLAEATTDISNILGTDRLCYLPYLQQMIACEKQLSAANTPTPADQS
jgi:hypothetical protein